MLYLKRIPNLMIFILIAGIYQVAYYPMLGQIDLSQVHLGYSAQHWLGTDYFGRDLFSYILKAVSYDLIIAIALSSTNYLIGSFTALAWIYLSPRLQIVLHTLIVAINSIPKILLILIAMQSNNVLVLFICLCIFTQWAKFALIIKPSLALETQKPHYIDARLNKHSMWHIMYHHLYPCIHTYIKSMYPYSIMHNISTLTTLRYLGFGFSDHAPSLGHVLAGQKIQPNIEVLIITFCVYYILNNAMHSASSVKTNSTYS